MKKKYGNKILIIGAGFGQVPAILKAKELGIEVISVDKNPNAIGVSLVDDFFEIDVVDRDAILELVIKEKVQGVMTMQSDLPVPIIGYINDKMGFSGVSYDTAINCSIKNKTREVLDQNKVAQPKFKVVKNRKEVLEAIKTLDYPVIIKSCDSSGSRGVTKVKSIGDINNAIIEVKNNTRQKEFLVEEFIEGIEFGAQAFSVNGKCEIVLLHNDSLSSGDYMIPVGHSFPSFLNERKRNDAIKIIKSCVEALRIENGPSNIDLIFDKNDGRVKIIEVGARIGATCLPELVDIFIGESWVEKSIINALGGQVLFNKLNRQACAAVILESPRDGIIKEIVIPEDIYNLEGLRELELTVKVGDEVNILRKGTDRIGKVVGVGNNYEEAEKLVDKIKSMIKFIFVND